MHKLLKEIFIGTLYGIGIVLAYVVVALILTASYVVLYG